MSREQSLQAAHQRLTEAVALVTADDWRKALDFAARFHHYSFANTLLIYCQHAERYAAGDVPEPQPSRVAGFHRWKALGRAVHKGQRGYRILAPVTTTARVAHLPDGTQRRLGRNESAPSHAQVEHRRQFSGQPGTTAHVFDVSQTSGEPVPEPPRPRLLSGQAPLGMYDGLSRQAHARNFAVRDVSEAAQIGGANGRTDFTTRTIAIRADMPDLARSKTLAHELGHLLLHSPDSSDADQVRDSHTHRGRAEVEAEPVAFMVLTAHGIASDDYTLPYVAT